MILFGLTFLAISIVLAKPSPTVLGAFFSALIGLGYFMFMYTSINAAILWTISLFLFALVIVFEFGIFKFGPANSKAKVLTIIPAAILGFSILLGLAGYNPLIHISWTGNSWAAALNLLAVMMFSWLHVLNIAGYRPLGKNTTMWMLILALVAIVLSMLGTFQGWGLF
jgi:hypothetical protein